MNTTSVSYNTGHCGYGKGEVVLVGLVPHGLCNRCENPDPFGNSLGSSVNSSSSACDVFLMVSSRGSQAFLSDLFSLFLHMMEPKF